MKILEKKELKNITGGWCAPLWGTGVTHCVVTYNNGWECEGYYTYEGVTLDLHCGFFDY